MGTARAEPGSGRPAGEQLTAPAAATRDIPTPGLYASVFHILANTDPYTQTAAAVTDRLICGLTDEEARCLPAAVGGVLRLLRRDVERLRFAGEIAARFDLFETARDLADTAVSSGDRRLLLDAASVCGNPAAEQAARDRAAEAAAGDPTVLIRLDPRNVPSNTGEESLYRQCWPGTLTVGRFGLAPMVVLDRGLDARRVLRLAVSLDRAAAHVRRLAPHAPIPMWFGPHTVLVCLPATRQRVLKRCPGFPPSQAIVGGIPAGSAGTQALLREIDAVLPERQKLRLAA